MCVTPVAYKLAQSVMGQKMCFSIVCIDFAMRVENLIYAKIREIPYSHNVTKLNQQ